jgi:hypothetical protein
MVNCTGNILYLDKQAVMSIEELKRSDRTLTRIILVVILVAILNAGVSASLALSIQSKYASEQASQQKQSKVIYSNICKTLISLHEDSPPSGNQPARAYLQDLHERLGELASDLKC